MDPNSANPRSPAGVVDGEQTQGPALGGGVQLLLELANEELQLLEMVVEVAVPDVSGGEGGDEVSRGTLAPDLAGVGSVEAATALAVARALMEPTEPPQR